MIVKPAARFASSAFQAVITVGAVAVLLPTASFAASEHLRPLAAAEIKAGPQKSAKSALGVRDHLNLKPRTAAEIKAGPPKTTKSGHSVRDHLNLKPLTADEIKAGRRAIGT
jgi:hypothetical protein